MQDDEFCQFCNGLLIPMGRLGPLMWLRCRSCGGETSLDLTSYFDEDDQ
jgi:DNA-directed RNA polymerase subunit M/transcription elongation factor TFIIS